MNRMVAPPAATAEAQGGRPLWREPLRHSPFHPRVEALNHRWSWAPWAGCLSAPDLGDVEMEYAAIRNAASLYDVSPIIKYRVRGPGAAAVLDRLALRRASGLAVGAVHYTAWCDDRGRVMDDGTLFRLGPQDFRLCCQERHLPWLLDAARGFDAEVLDETEEVAGLSLQGPTSASVLRAMELAIDDLRPFRLVTVPFGAGALTVSRTGFTGDLGYELWVDPEGALPLWDRLTEAGAPWGLRAIGSAALDVARIEAGLIVAGTDFVPASQALREDRARSPFELGLDWMIDWDKGHFNGRRALLAERERGSRWALVGLDVAGNLSAAGSLVYRAGREEVGVVTSACWSPTAKRSLALAQVRRPHHGEGADLRVEIYALRELQYSKRMERARVVPRPFLPLARRRATPPGAW